MTVSTIDGLRPVTAIDVESMTTFELPRAGENNFGDWLRDNGYVHVEDIPLDLQALDLFHAKHRERYALYHPILVDLNTECLFINIPSESFARLLAATAQQLQRSQLRLQPLHLLQFTRFGSRLEIEQGD